MRPGGAFSEGAYSVFRALYRLFFATAFRWEVEGLEHIPATGGAVLAVNHASALDPPLAGAALRRKIWYVGRATLVRNRLVEFILACQHLIPITRGEADLGATKRIIRLIRSGNIVLMFPEGTRSEDGALGLAREGIGMFISRARTDVIPCYISGAWRALPKGCLLPRPRKIRVAYGPLIRYGDLERFPRDRGGYRLIGAVIMERIGALKERLG
ncbi:MAG: lysophospholipid acyltransferase family protein, partial [bacterium]|nr:lysophospholipid acyltransferase family protein [bacterium]